MKSAILLLEQPAYISILDKPDEGCMAYTYLCLIEWPDGVKRQSYVKMFSMNEGIGVFNEILGYILSKAEELPVAEYAGVLIIPDGLKATVDVAVAPLAFVTSKVNGNSPASYYNVGDAIRFNALFKVLDNWDKLSHTIAFDEWVANQDRNLGNMIIDSHNNVTLIDHSNLPVGLVWGEQDLQVGINPRNVLYDVFRQNPSLPQKTDILGGCKSQSMSFSKAKDEVSYWCDQLLPPELKSSLMPFIEQRANFSRDRLIKRLGLLPGVA
ncbi:Uncharacterised protein [Yersinia intermedia]|uniref:hypothetical protein n=1 Tax=Yersinia intermedia TaxID=631 RepID=UPI0005AC3563|nr:hypothetical protein [Yersinia intermedia]AJJ18406.1 hypothetical protein CH53_4160 [Yersinia intermedia]MCB5324993.1 hypothetical protein [Yersinia intermedia]CQD98196.1 Uncharacterised protein [Yersinia intermedia]